MKTRAKKLLALLLATVMALSVAACGNNNVGPDEQNTQGTEANEQSAQGTEVAEDLYYNLEGFPIVKEPISIEVAGIQGATNDWQNNFMIRKIEEMMGIKMNCTTYADKTVWSTQYATMLASDSLPDLIMAIDVDKATINGNGEEGFLLDMADYLDIMPNFAKFLEENPEYASYTKAPDGSIYSISNVRLVETPLYTLYVSKADQEKYGFSVEDIKTTEDFYNVLKSIKEQNPDAIPLSLTLETQSGQRGAFVIRTAFGIFSNAISPLFSVDAQGNVVLDEIGDNYKAYLTYMNKLWEEDLLDHESFIMTTAEYRSKVANEPVVFWHDWSYLPKPTGSGKDIYQEYDALSVLTSEYNDVPTYVHADPYTASARLMVSANTEYPEAICRLIDYVFSEEGQVFVNYGVEGETFDYIDDGLGNMVVNHDNYWDKEKYTSAAEWKTQEVHVVGSLQFVTQSDARLIAKNASDAELEKLIFEDDKYTYTAEAFHEKYIRAQAEVERYASYLALALNAEEVEATAQPLTDMKLLMEQSRAQFISGGMDIEKDWDAYVKQIKVFWDQIQPHYQSAQDRLAAN